MDDNAAREDACREYQSSLEDLTFNSKPHINMLTILAEENLNFAKDIVAIIEAQISKAPAAEKLPVLYLVDSIVKNVGGEYLAVFAKNLITSFICVFEKVDENTRKSLFKLRSTWDDVFPLKKLYALDVRVNSVDPAWPIKPLPPTVNASIHVNPKFLKQVSAAPPVITQSSLTQEQLIRQQLLAKQKQLLELQQKKIELELEQTKAQLAGGFVLPTPAGVSAPAAPSAAAKPITQSTPVVRPWIPPQTQSDTKPLATRDPRLNRPGPAAPPHPKEQPAGKKDSPPATGSPALTPEKRPSEKSTRLEKTRVQRKEAQEEKPKSKSPSPMAKSVQSKNKQAEAEVQKSADGTKKDPRLRKRTQDKSGEAKDDELKEKKRCSDKKEREEASQGAEPQRFNRGKLVNGSVTKHDREGSADRLEFKTGGNARTHARKRTAPAPGRAPQPPPQRGRTGGRRRAEPGAARHPLHPLTRRGNLEESAPTSRHTASPAERTDSRSHDGGGGKEAKEAPHRWRSGWEENKHVKMSDDSHVKPGPQRHKPYSTPTRPTTPRTPKHRLSVDANLQIPEVLNSASKKDLLRRASKRLESGEISQEDFLNMAHQIKHFFQYQEEKLQRSESWDDSGDFPAKKQPLPLTLSYYEHKSKLRKTQVTHRVREWNSPLTERQRYDEREEQKSGYDAPRRYDSRHPDPRRLEGPLPAGTVVHRNCPSPAGLDPPAPRFERERLSPLHQKDSAEMSPIPRFESPNSEHSDDGPLNLDVAPHHPHPPPPPKSILKPSRGGPLSSVRQHSNSPGHTPPHDGGHLPSRYDGPEHMAPPRPHPPGWYDDPARFDGPHHQGPGRFDGGPPHHNMPERFDGPDGPHMAHGPMRGGDGMGRFDGPPHPQGPGRFDGPMGQQPAVRFGDQGLDRDTLRDRCSASNHRGGPPNQMGPMRFEGPGRFEGPASPVPGTTCPTRVGPALRRPSRAAGPPRFPPQHNMQAPLRPMAPPMYDNPMAPIPRYVCHGGVCSCRHGYRFVYHVCFCLFCFFQKLRLQWLQQLRRTEEEEEEEQEVEEGDVPDLTSFSIDDMKQRYESVVTKLYSGNQCCLCSMRFTAAQTDMYADHLDWHFRQNHAGKVASKKVTHRRWYYSLTDWIEFEEIADLEERAKSQFFEKENEEEVQKNQAAAKEKEFQSVRATKDQVGESCEICQEPFETYWVEEEEDWFLKNAIRVDDKNFHPSCFEDYKNTSSYLDITPSPNKLLLDHPLSAFVKTEQEEEGEEASTSCAIAAAAAAAASVKQEVASEAVELPDVKKEEEQEVLTEEVQSQESKA
uniref:Pre-mRNA cleavage complex 2 protein Pcf11 n=1 Tax=Lates calcarifer TaxID=8187 RepID=A0A4W6FCA6_LATCA